MHLETPTQRWTRYRTAIGGLSLPLAWLDEEALTANADALVARAGRKRVRWGTKSIRSVGVMRWLVERFPSSARWLTMTAQEAVWLSSLGFDDLWVGYPSLAPEPLRAVARAVQQGRSIALMADREEHLDRYQSIANDEGVELSVIVDLDVSSRLPGLHFGVHRSSLLDAASLERLLEKRNRWGALRFAGVMAYEAQIAGVPDHSGNLITDSVARILKRRSEPHVRSRRAESLAILKSAGLPIEHVNGGGTGSLEFTASDPSVTEITAGSGLFHPALFDGYDAFQGTPAAGFALEVTRAPQPGVLTALGGGYMASGTGTDRSPRPYLPEGMSLLPHEGAGEVQTPFRIPPQNEVALGEPVFFRHLKAGELCERFQELVWIRGDRVVKTTPTYRGEGKCFL